MLAVIAETLVMGIMGCCQIFVALVIYFMSVRYHQDEICVVSDLIFRSDHMDNIFLRSVFFDTSMLGIALGYLSVP